MSSTAIDYESIAKQYGGEPAQDYASVAKQYGGEPLAPPAAAPQQDIHAIAAQHGGLPLTAAGPEDMSTVAGAIPGTKTPQQVAGVQPGLPAPTKAQGAREGWMPGETERQQVKPVTDFLNKPLLGPDTSTDQGKLAEQEAQSFRKAHPIAGGVVSGIQNTIQGMTTPANLAMLAVLPESKIISAFFAAQAAHGAYNSAEDAYQAFREGKNSEAAQHITEAGLNGLMAGLAGYHAASTHATPTSETSQPTETSQNVPRGTFAESSPETNPTTDETKPAIGEAEPETGRPVLQQSEHPEVNQAAAKAEHPIVKSQIEDAIEPIEGAEVSGARAEKTLDRIEEKIDEEGQSPKTVRDYSGYRIAVDTPEAKNQVVKALKDHFEVPDEQDEFEKGNDETGFHGHTLQVREPGSPVSHEVQILPREVADSANSRHDLYEKAREGDKDAAAQMKAANEADWKAFHSRQGETKPADRNGKQVEVPLKGTGGEDAVRVGRPEEVLQREPGQAGETGGERGRVEPIKQGEGPARAQKAGETAVQPTDREFQKGSRVRLKDGQTGTVQYFQPEVNGGQAVARVRLDSGVMRKSVQASDMRPEAAEPETKGKQWIGVDLDGTLAKYDGFKGPTVIGEPIPAMVDRVRQWLAEGKNVKILTARVSEDASGVAKRAIQDWAEKNLGQRIDVTDVKDAHMVHLYDDRAVPVERNTGRLLGQPQPEESNVVRQTTVPEGNTETTGNAERPTPEETVRRKPGERGVDTELSEARRLGKQSSDKVLADAQARNAVENIARARIETTTLKDIGNAKVTVLNPDAYHSLVKLLTPEDDWKGAALDPGTASRWIAKIRSMESRLRQLGTMKPAAEAAKALALDLDKAREADGSLLLLRSDYDEPTVREELAHRWQNQAGLRDSEAIRELTNRPEFEQINDRLKSMDYDLSPEDQASELLAKAMAGDPDMEWSLAQQKEVVSAGLKALVDEHGPSILENLPPTDPAIKSAIEEVKTYAKDKVRGNEREASERLGGERGGEARADRGQRGGTVDQGKPSAGAGGERGVQKGGAAEGKLTNKEKSGIFENLFKRVFHGTPYKFDRFTLDHIGEGEGAQAYGWGLYFASNKHVAEYYSRSVTQKNGSGRWNLDGKPYAFDLSTYFQPGKIVDSYLGKDKVVAFHPGEPGAPYPRDTWSVDVIAVDPKTEEPLYNGRVRNHKTPPDEKHDALGQALKLVHRNETIPDAIDRLRINAQATWRPSISSPKISVVSSGADLLEKFKDRLTEGKGHVYEVEIPEDHTMLDWDRPLSEQPEKVRDALGADESSRQTGAQAYDELSQRMAHEHTFGKGDKTWTARIKDDAAASGYLHALGIEGIKYLDARSRGKGEGSHNYVIFDENAIKIIKGYKKSEALFKREKQAPETPVARFKRMSAARRLPGEQPLPGMGEAVEKQDEAAAEQKGRAQESKLAQFKRAVERDKESREPKGPWYLKSQKIIDPIPDAMREGAMQGQPLFKRAESATTVTTGKHDTGKSLDELIEDLAKAPKRSMSMEERIESASDFGLDSIAGVKEGLDGAMEKVKGAAAGAWNAWQQPAPWTDYKQSLGDIEKASFKAAVAVERLQHELKRVAPSRRERDAMTVYGEARNDQEIKRWAAQADNLPDKRWSNAFKDAADLSTQQKALATMLRKYYDEQLNVLTDAGLLPAGVSHYVMHMYAADPETLAKLRSAADFSELSEDPRANGTNFLRRRVYKSYFEAIQNGERPETLDAGIILSMYHDAFAKTFLTRGFIRSMLYGVDEGDGRSIAILENRGGWVLIDAETKNGRATGEYRILKQPKRPDNTEDYVRIPASQLRNFMWELTDQDREILAPGYKDMPKEEQLKLFGPDDPRFPVPKGKILAMKGDVVIHPKYAARVSDLVTRSWFDTKSDHLPVNVLKGAIKAVGKVGALAKSSILYGSGFHQFQLGLHAVGHWINPLKLEDLDSISKDPIILEGVAHGLKMVDIDPEGVLSHLPGMQAYHHYLFRNWIPRLKAKAYKIIDDRNVHEYGGGKTGKPAQLTRDEIHELSASQTNAAFSGQNPAFFNRLSFMNNRTYKAVEHLIMFSPDFTKARTQYAFQALGKFGYEQRMALLRESVLLFSTARIVNLALSNWPGRQKKEGIAGARWAPQDAFEVVIPKDPIFGMFGGKKIGPRTAIGDIVGLIKDPGTWAYNRLNPATLRPAIEFATGRDNVGRQESRAHFFKEYAKQIIPIPFQKLFTTNDEGFADSFLTAMGLQMANYRTPLEQMAHKLRIENIPDKPESEEKQDEGRRNVQMVQKIREGKATTADLWNLVNQGKMTPREASAVMARAQMTELQYDVHHLSLDDAMKIYAKADNSERAELHDILEEKRASGLKNMTDEAAEKVDKQLKELGIE